MANTFGELILEYENYEYSKEYYELLKESYEIHLTEVYIKSCGFNNYLTESESSKLTENNSSRKESLFEKIKTIIVSVLKNIGKFFMNFFKGISKRNDKLKNSDNNINISIENDKLISIINDAWPQKYRDEGFDITVDNNSTYSDKINDLLSKNSDNNDICNKLKAAFSRDTIIVKLLPKGESNEKPIVLDIDSFRLLIDALDHSVEVSRSMGSTYESWDNISKIYKTINDKIDAISKNNVVIIKIDNEYISKQIALFGELIQKIDNIGSLSVKLIGDIDANSEISKLTKMLKLIGADTIKMYSYVLNYMNTVRYQLGV